MSQNDRRIQRFDAATAPDSLPDGGRFLALDSLRGVAALGVALYHVTGNSGIVATGWHHSLNLFVDFFFVLSGFVIAGAYGERLMRGFSTLRFMLLRLGRLYPLHLTMVLVYVAAEIARGAVQPGTPAFAPPRDLASLPSVLLLVQAFVPEHVATWNVQSWSISVEIWLYLLAALAFRLTGRSAFLLAGVVGVAALVAIPVLARIDEETFRAAVWALRGLAGFGLGAALWPVHRWLARRGAIAPGRAGLYEGLSLLAIAVVMQMGLPHLIADPVFALAVLAFAFDRGIVSRLLHARFFVLLGTLSYSIYMIHGFIVGRWLDLVRYVAPGAIDGRMLLLPALETNLLVLAILASVVVLSWLSWRLIEHPAREWSRRRAARFGAAREEAAAPTI